MTNHETAMSTEASQTPEQINPDQDATKAEKTPETANSEAAKYRRQLRDTEAERDTLAGQLKTARENIVTHMLSKSPATLDAITAAGYEIDSLLDDDGNIDQEKLDAAAADTCERFNITIPMPRVTSGALSRVNSVKLEPEPSFANAFTPNPK